MPGGHGPNTQKPARRVNGMIGIKRKKVNPIKNRRELSWKQLAGMQQKQTTN